MISKKPLVQRTIKHLRALSTHQVDDACTDARFQAMLAALSDAYLFSTLARELKSRRDTGSHIPEIREMLSIASCRISAVS